MTEFSHSAGGIVLNARGEVALVRQRDGSWSFPKGGLREGEDPRACAAREISEETGIVDLSMIKILKSYTRYSLTNSGAENPDRLKRMTMYLFAARNDEEELRPADPRIAEARWVKREDVVSMLSHPRDQEFFEQAGPELDDGRGERETQRALVDDRTHG